jgi:hypothetical protein
LEEAIGGGGIDLGYPVLDFTATVVEPPPPPAPEAVPAAPTVEITPVATQQTPIQPSQPTVQLSASNYGFSSASSITQIDDAPVTAPEAGPDWIMIGIIAGGALLICLICICCITRIRNEEKRRMNAAANRMEEQRARIEQKKAKLADKLAKKERERLPKQVDDDVVTMDGNSVYSKVGYNKKAKDTFKNRKYPRKESILDAFEAVANQSHEEILGNVAVRASLEISPRKSQLEIEPVEVTPGLEAQSVKAPTRKSA